MSNMFLNIVSTFKNDGIAAATRQLGAFGKEAGGLGSTLGKVGATLASFGIAAKAVQFTSQSIDSARDLERNMYSLQTVFSQFAPTMENFVKGAADIGLSQKDAAKASVFLGSVLKQSGFSMADVTTETQKLVSLGVDLAATYGYDVQEALLGMTALFRGEYDPIEKFGVAMKQSEINAELAARKLTHLTGAARRNAEQVIRMELLYQRAADATGAFTGQSGNLFVEQKRVQAQFENMQATIGQQLLPVMVNLTESLRPLIEYLGPLISKAVEGSLPILESIVDFITDLSDKTTLAGGSFDFLIGVVGATVSSFKDLYTIFEPLILLVGGLTAAVFLLGGALTFINLHPTIAAFTLLAAAFVFVNETSKKFKFQVDNTGASVTSFNTTLYASANASQYVADKYGIAATAVENLNNKLQKNPDVAAEASARNRELGGYLAFLSGRAQEAKKAMDGLTDSSAAGASAAQQAIDAAAQAAAQAAEEAARRQQERLEKRKAAFKSFADSVKSIFGGIKESIMSAFSLPDLGNSVSSITKNIKKLIENTKAFAKNITTLSQQGLTNDLLQQVIAAGPMAGGKLAASLVASGPSSIGQLNQAYGEFGGIASQIAGVGTRSAFNNAATVNTYNIEVNGGVGSGASIGKAIVDAIKAYERTSGAVWQGAN
jgi:hypothetical protein